MSNTSGSNDTASTLRSVLVRGVEEYNKYHRPEAFVQISQVSDRDFELLFRGPFCQSCGIQDYFDDFIYDLESVSMCTASIAEAIWIGEDSYRVKFSEVRPIV